MNHQNESTDQFSIPRVALTNYYFSNAKFTKNQLRYLTDMKCESENSTDKLRSAKNSRKKLYFIHKGTKPIKTKSSEYLSSSSSLSSSNNHSNKSDNSLLLSVENLDNFNRSNLLNTNSRDTSELGSFVYNTQEDQRKQMIENIKSILAVEDLNLIGACKNENGDFSCSSSISTTNFTVVTFDKKKETVKAKSICRRSHQVTILILAMTIIFVIGIFALVCALEMRFQNMPR